MSNDTKSAILRAGIIPKENLLEMERWGVSIPDAGEINPDKRDALEDIRESIESKDVVEYRVTSLDELKAYETNKQIGRLYYSVPDNSTYNQKKSKTTFIKINYAKTAAGFYLIPWSSEDIFDLMVDPGTYLKPADEERVHFKDVTSLFYGDKKTFMLCRPATAKDLREDGDES